jgi:hypothetical protein
MAKACPKHQFVVQISVWRILIGGVGINVRNKFYAATYSHKKIKYKKSDIEFFAKISTKRLTSLADDFKESQAAFRKDELGRELRLSRKIKQAPI